MEEKLAEATAQPDPNWHTMQADAKCKAIEGILLELAAEHRGDEKEKPPEDKQTKIRELIGNRKRERAAGNKENVKQTCKLLRREIRARDKASKTAKIEKILREFKGLRAIAGIRNDGKIALVGSMQSGDGSIKTDRQDIANVFANF